MLGSSSTTRIRVLGSSTHQWSHCSLCACCAAPEPFLGEPPPAHRPRSPQVRLTLENVASPLDARVTSLARTLAKIGDHRAPVVQASWWSERMLEWAMSHPSFK